MKVPTIQSYVSEQKTKWKFITELSPCLSDFYERLKMALKKTFGKKYLTSLQKQTFLSVTEAVLYSRPLVYVRDDLNEGVIVTPSHFLLLNTEIGRPTVKDDDKIDNPDYEPNKPLSKKAFLDVWKK